jgi:quinol monooxygenase YgiN
MAEEFVRAIKDGGLQAAVRAEDGCMQYDYHISCEKEDTVVLLECWRDKAALKVHASQPTMQEIGAVKDEYVLNVDLKKFTIQG